MRFFPLPHIAVGVSLLVASPLVGSHAVRADTPTEGSLRFYRCDGEASERSVTLQGELVLDRRFLPVKPADSDYTHAARAQLSYFKGYFLNSESRAARGTWITGSEPAEVEILATAETRYPRALLIDPVRHPDVEITEPYLLAALKAGRTSEQDAAVRVQYRARFKAAHCRRKGETELTVSLPIDPYLFYWAIPPSERRRIEWRTSSFEVNPCADAEIADLPHPQYFWYFWDPTRAAKDAKGRGFDCGKTLREGRDVRTFAISVSPSERSPTSASILRTELLPRDRPLRATVIFGIIDAKEAKASTLTMKDLLQGAPSAIPADRGSRYFQAFARLLPEVVATTRTDTSRIESESIAVIEGKLRRSGRPIELTAYFGPTDVLSGDAPRHWKALAEGIAKADMVFYNGHSGLGKNVSLASLPPEESRIVDASHPPTYQIFGYLSCFSYSYFAGELSSHRIARNPAAQTDTVLTLSDFTSERGPLGLLEYIDRRLEGAKSPALTGGRWLVDADALMVRAYHE